MEEYFNDQETRDKLDQLRGDIVLCSLYADDYENSFGIDRHDVQDFFDGYIEFLEELAEEDYEEGRAEEKMGLDDLDAFLDEYDTIGNLENWYDIVQGGGSAAFTL